MQSQDQEDEVRKLVELGRAVIRTEASAINELERRVDENFARACLLILACTGRTVVIGMGKSGHIGGKIAATLASTGTPAARARSTTPPTTFPANEVASSRPSPVTTRSACSIVS